MMWLLLFGMSRSYYIQISFSSEILDFILSLRTFRLEIRNTFSIVCIAHFDLKCLNNTMKSENVHTPIGNKYIICGKKRSVRL